VSNKQKDGNLPGEETVINGKTYMVRQLTMRKWFDLEALLMRVVGPVLADFIADGKGFKSLFDISAKSAAAGLYTFTSRASADDHDKMLSLLAGCTWVDDQPIGKIYAVYWPKNMSDLAPYIKHALVVQFSDFFGGLLSVIPSTDDE
jgi:hypothetical protein